MSRSEKEQRYKELLKRHNIAPEPATLPAGGEPLEAIPLDEMEERDWLKNDLKTE